MIDRTGLILEIFGDRAADPRRRAAGRARASLLPEARAWSAPGPTSSASAAASASSAAPARRRSRPTAARIDERIVRIKQRARQGAAHPRPAPRGARARALSGRRPGRLHQRRQVDAVQPPDRRRRAGQGHALRDPRPDHARHRAAVTGARRILSDTVGFISDLPTQLVAAFRATLEEVLEADLILHVRDIAHPESEMQAENVHADAGRARHRPTDERGRHDRGLEQDRRAADPAAPRRCARSPCARRGSPRSRR